MDVECAVVTCRHNEPFSKNYGYCRSEKNPVLKFRLAGDFGRGTIVMLECLNLALPGESSDDV